MSAETPERKKSPANFSLPTLVGMDVLNMAGFNSGVVSMDRETEDGRKFELYFGKPDAFDEEPRVVVVAGELVRENGSWYYAWHVGTVPGVGRGEREDAEEFDAEVERVMAGEVVAPLEMRGKILSLIPERRRFEALMPHPEALND